MRIFCAFCSKDAPLMRDDGDGGRLVPGICQVHLQYMRAKLLGERKESAR